MHFFANKVYKNVRNIHTLYLGQRATSYCSNWFPLRAEFRISLLSFIPSSQRWRWWISACTGSCLPLWYLWQRPILRSWHSYTLATALHDAERLPKPIEYGAEIPKGSSSYSIGWWRPPHIPQDIPHQCTALSGGYSHKQGTISDSKAKPNHLRPHPSSILQLHDLILCVTYSIAIN